MNINKLDHRVTKIEEDAALALKPKPTIEHIIFWDTDGPKPSDDELPPDIDCGDYIVTHIFWDESMQDPEWAAIMERRRIEFEKRFAGTELEKTG